MAAVPDGQRTIRTLAGAGGTALEEEPPVCTTVTDWPATASVVVRVPEPVFASMLKLTEPIPDPEPPSVMVIHGTALVAVHEHCVPATTLSVRIVLVAPMEKLVGVML